MGRHDNDTQFRRALLIGSSFFFAALLTIMPLPVWLVWLRPAWLLMVLMYWCLRNPYQVGLGIAWLLGLFADILCGTLLGEQAFGFVLVAFLVARFHVRINHFPFHQQMLIVFGLLVVYQMVVLWVQAALGQLPDLWLYWLPSVVGTLLWPLVYGVLETCRK